MRKILLLPLLLLLAACAATSPPANPAAEAETDTLVTEAVDTVDTAVNQERAPVVTGATPAEAALVREQDWSKGTAEPAVSIIEYGDFQ